MTIPELRELGYTFAIRHGWFQIMLDMKGPYGAYVGMVARSYNLRWTLDETMEQARLEAIEHFVLRRLTS